MDNEIHVIFSETFVIKITESELLRKNSECEFNEEIYGIKYITLRTGITGFWELKALNPNYAKGSVGLERTTRYARKKSMKDSVTGFDFFLLYELKFPLYNFTWRNEISK